MSSTRWLAAILLLLACSEGIAAGHAPRCVERKTLGLAQRLEAQRALEQVYWQHRTWPSENPGVKPSLERVLPGGVLQTRMERSLRLSSALERVWGRKVTAAQLQAELDRMARETHAPGFLRELFAALGDDAALLAETLARPSLAERLTRDAYARDPRFHGGLRRQAEAALAAGRTDGAEHRVVRYVRDDDPASTEKFTGSGVQSVASDDFSALSRRLRTRFGVGRQDSLPLHVLAPMREENDAFETVEVVGEELDTVTVLEFRWPKQSFDQWWQAEESSFEPEIPADTARFRLPRISLTGCTPDTWEPFAAELPDPYGGDQLVWTGSEMIVWGGYNIDGLPLKSGRYTPATNTWSGMAEVPEEPRGRDGHAAVWTGKEMLVWGGRDSAGTFLAVGRGYDPVTDTWRALPGGPLVPTLRTAHTAIWTGTDMIVWGGRDTAGHALGSGGRFAPALNMWLPMTTTNAPQARWEHTAVWTGSEMIVWGGRSGPPVLSTGARYDPLFDMWRPMRGGLAGRRDHTAVWTGAAMIVWGGVNDLSQTNSGALYFPGNDFWAPMNGSAPTARSGHSAVWTGKEMIVWGGIDYDRGSNTGGRYDPVTDHWLATSLGAGVPTARRDQGVVWTGTEMIVWGGRPNFGDDFTNTGARYDPATDTWASTSTAASEPGARQGHRAVWTGAEMIVWGGAWDNTGARYDPATDVWRPTSTGAHVPEGRSGATAVWTGTEMIIWGGSHSSPDADEPVYPPGGRYDPTTDSWNPKSMEVPGQPATRASHGAVWTGTEMIVWGGGRGIDTFNSGGRYDPEHNQWRPTAVDSNTPLGGAPDTALWTGKELLVWIGYREVGGRYDPLTDRWARITSTGHPVGFGRAVWTGEEMLWWGYENRRYDPSGDLWSPMAPLTIERRDVASTIWTGEEMIVWGGQGFAPPYRHRDGARYSPRSDAWVQTGEGPGVPTARMLHTAVWTGSEMLVWGGLPLTSTGSAYCAKVPDGGGSSPRPIDSVAPHQIPQRTRLGQ